MAPLPLTAFLLQTQFPCVLAMLVTTAFALGATPHWGKVPVPFKLPCLRHQFVAL